MNCQKCGASVLSQNKFCPECGTKSQFSPENSLLQDSLISKEKKPSPRLFKVLLTFILLAILIFIFISLTSKDITDIAKAQLLDIREGKITESYYDYTSKSFQKETSLSEFKEFLIKHPEFAKSSSIRFVDRNVDNDSGILKAYLMVSNGVEMPLQYSLVKEGENWKILNIKLDGLQSLSHEEAFNKKPFEDVITGQLESIRQNKLQEAYENFTSASFKKSTSYNDFVEFIHSQVGFNENASINLKDLNFDNNIGKFSGTLKSKNQIDFLVVYDLVQEGGVWKVMHIEVQKSIDNHKKNMLSISQVVLGSSVDRSGIVTDPQTVFKSDSGDIFLNVHFVNGKAGTNIEVMLKHALSNSSMAPVSTRLVEDGDANAIFIFSPPTSGWPEGDYNVKVSATTGYINYYDFKVVGK